MGFMDSMFGGGESSVDNSGAFADFSRQMRERMPVYDPWINTGSQSRDRLFDEYGRLTRDPNAVQDQVAAGFYESPYQKYMQDMVTKRMNYNATNTGMLGSGAAQRALMDELTKMTGQFENDYINRGMNSYGMGVQGYQGLTDLGFKALGEQTNLFEQAAAGDLQGQMSRNAYDAAQEANEGNFWGNLIGTGGGAVIGGLFGGPAGAVSGASMGRSLFGGGGNAGGGQGLNLPNNWNVGNWFNSSAPVSDWSATGNRMPQFDFNTGSRSY
jgi:hypothetical protein